MAGEDFRMRWVFFAWLMPLAACNNHARETNAVLGRYQAAEASGDGSAKCDLAGQVSEAYSRVPDAEKQNEWNLKRIADCAAIGKIEPRDDIGKVSDNFAESMDR